MVAVGLSDGAIHRVDFSAGDAGATTTFKESAPYSYLVQIDFPVRTASVVGSTEVADISGLGYWRGSVYGFTTNGETVKIDVHTGKGSVVATQPKPFDGWIGAGVGTNAPVNVK